MKILFANNFYYLRGGSERVFFDEMAMLERHGHEIAAYSRHFNRNLPSAYSPYFSGPINYEDVPLLQKITVAAKMIYSAENRHSIGTLMDQFRPDLMHVHNITGRLTTSILDAARVRRIPTVMTLHDSKLICPSYLMLHNGAVCDACNGSRFYHCLRKRCHKGSLMASLVYTTEAYLSRLCKKYDMITSFLCPSQFLLEKHAQAGIAHDRLVHLPNCMDVTSSEACPAAGNYLLFAGRLSHEKGVTTLLKALCGLDLPLKIAGEGPLRKQLECFCSERGLSRVEFLGHQTGDDLRNLFSGAALVVFPSECYENAPMTILEAYAASKPVLGSRIGGIPELVREGETGQLFEPGSHEELRAKLSLLWNDRKTLQEMGQRARSLVEALFSPSRHYDRLIGVYEKALALSQSRS